MNRDQRRHPEKDASAERPDDAEPKERPWEEMLRPERTQDDFDVRAKNAGHKKKTADKWNQ